MARQKDGWIGVDLDGVLARCDWVEVWDGSIGPPIPKMVARVKAWLAEGRDVRIMTARVAPYEFRDGGDDHARSVEQQRRLIEAWCLEHIGQVLPITATKDYGMVALYDDRAIQVIENTGELVRVEEER